MGVTRDNLCLYRLSTPSLNLVKLVGFTKPGRPAYAYALNAQVWVA